MASDTSRPSRRDRASRSEPIGYLFLFLFLFRALNALSIRTFFQPDEYFQALEPAWETAFGADSGAWITWEWRFRLRSSFHPLLFSALYRLCDSAVGESLREDALYYAPKLLQALIAATADYYTYKLSQRLFSAASGGAAYGRATLVLTLLSPWNWFCSVRTFSNSLETALTAFAFAHWPWEGPGKRRRFVWMKPLLGAAFATVLRPTNALIWAVLVASALARLPRSGAVRLVASAAACGLTALGACAVVDRVFYGLWTLPLWNFLYFNIVMSLAQFYGVNRADFYFTEGLPILLTTLLPLAAAGLWAGLARGGRYATGATAGSAVAFQTLSVSALVTPIVLSFIGHKEVRFLYPLLPALIAVATPPAVDFYGWATSATPTGAPSWARRGAALALLVATVGLSGYASQVHQRGVVDVLHHLRAQHNGGAGGAAGTTVGFLMPCHSTPWRSHLISRSIRGWALTCEPPVHLPADGEERAAYEDEADRFYADPDAWLDGHLSTSVGDDGGSFSGTAAAGQQTAGLVRAWPDRLVMFDQLAATLQARLVSGNGGAEPKYAECWRGFNSHWHDDWRRRGDVVVYCRSDR